jgi:hypothetical protein
MTEWLKDDLKARIKKRLYYDESHKKELQSQLGAELKARRRITGKKAGSKKLQNQRYISEIAEIGQRMFRDESFTTTNAVSVLTKRGYDHDQIKIIIDESLSLLGNTYNKMAKHK